MYLGIDIGGTTIKYGFIDEDGRIHQKNSIKTIDDKDKFLFNLKKIILESKDKELIKGIGISAPGIIDEEGCMITAGAIKSIYGINLKKELQTVTDLPIIIENDANAAAIAEQWIGNAQGIQNYLCIVLGTGVGGGIIYQNKLIRGAHGMAGEFGWMVIKEINESDNIEELSLNQRVAIIGGLCHRYNQIKKSLNPLHEPVWDAREIFIKENEEEEASVVVKSFYEDLTIGLLNLISCFDPEIVLIGGGISANNEFFDRLYRTISEIVKKHHSINYLMGETIAPIKPAKLMNDAGMIGAVYQLKTLYWTK